MTTAVLAPARAAHRGHLHTAPAAELSGGHAALPSASRNRSFVELALHQMQSDFLRRGTRTQLEYVPSPRLVYHHKPSTSDAAGGEITSLVHSLSLVRDSAPSRLQLHGRFELTVVDQHSLALSFHPDADFKAAVVALLKNSGIPVLTATDEHGLPRLWIPQRAAAKFQEAPIIVAAFRDGQRAVFSDSALFAQTLARVILHPAELAERSVEEIYRMARSSVPVLWGCLELSPRIHRGFKSGHFVDLRPLHEPGGGGADAAPDRLPESLVKAAERSLGLAEGILAGRGVLCTRVEGRRGLPQLEVQLTGAAAAVLRDLPIIAAFPNGRAQTFHDKADFAGALAQPPLRVSPETSWSILKAQLELLAAGPKLLGYLDVRLPEAGGDPQKAIISFVPL